MIFMMIGIRSGDLLTLENKFFLLVIVFFFFVM